MVAELLWRREPSYIAGCAVKWLSAVAVALGYCCDMNYPFFGGFLTGTAACVYCGFYQVNKLDRVNLNLRNHGALVAFLDNYYYPVERLVYNQHVEVSSIDEGDLSSERVLH